MPEDNNTCFVCGEWINETDGALEVCSTQCGLKLDSWVDMSEEKAIRREEETLELSE